MVDGDPAELAQLLIKGGMATFFICAEDKGEYIEGWLEE